jgi:hypothetical protein
MTPDCSTVNATGGTSLVWPFALVAPSVEGGEHMRAYYVKVFRHLLPTTVLTGFISGVN